MGWWALAGAGRRGRRWRGKALAGQVPSQWPDPVPDAHCGQLPPPSSFQQRVERFHENPGVRELPADTYISRTIALVNCGPPLRCGGGVGVGGTAALRYPGPRGAGLAVAGHSPAWCLLPVRGLCKGSCQDLARNPWSGREGRGRGDQREKGGCPTCPFWKSTLGHRVLLTHPQRSWTPPDVSTSS